MRRACRVIVTGMPQTDSRLQKAMRALLAIIAGLLIADMLRNVVDTIRAGGPHLWANAAIVIGAALFLFRIVVDNILFYEKKDTTSGGYVTRVALIVLDLISYALCYDVVARLDPGGDEWLRFSRPVLAVALLHIAMIETFHSLWCRLWLPLADAASKDHLRKWSWLSSGTALGILAAASWATSYLAIAWMFSLGGLVSAAFSLAVLSDYYPGDPELLVSPPAAPAQTPPGPSERPAEPPRRTK